MKLSQVKMGDTIVADGGFTCMKAGPHKVEGDADGLFVPCSDGKHYLAGQEDEPCADLIGLDFPNASSE